MNKKVIIGLVILIASLAGFKYLRDNELIMEFRKEDIMKLVEQVSKTSQEKESDNLNQKTQNQEIKITTPGVKIVGTQDEQKILVKEGEYKEELLKKEEISGQEGYLKRNKIAINENANPSYEYLRLCGKCHGYKATGYNNNRELMGPGILHYSSTSLYETLMDYKHGVLQGEIMTKTVESIEPMKLREISEEIQEYKINKY